MMLPVWDGVSNTTKNQQMRQWYRDTVWAEGAEMKSGWQKWILINLKKTIIDETSVFPLADGWIWMKWPWRGSKHETSTNWNCNKDSKISCYEIGRQS